jgi:hypothetical protein
VIIQYPGGKSGHYSIPAGVINIGDSAFSGCESLTSIEIPYSVTIISYFAFQKCSGLSGVEIPDSVARLGDNAFDKCTGITEVIIGEGVLYLGEAAFSECVNLSKVYLNSGQYSMVFEDTFSNVAPGAVVYASPTSANIPPEGMLWNGMTVKYSDISQWAADDVGRAAGLNLVPDKFNRNFTRRTTRAEFCALAVRVYETFNGAIITERKTFDDTKDVYVEKAATVGIVSGVGDNMFYPDARLTREEAAAMLSRLAAAIGKPLSENVASFADNAKISKWAIEHVGQVQAAGIMTGNSDNAFDPKGAYTREQSIVTILRLYEYMSIVVDAPASDD